MSKHLTIRMAWHDNKWNGKVCLNPEGNTYCTGAHSLLSGRIEKNKQTAAEQALKGQCIQGNFTPEAIPPCYWSINAFGDRSFAVKHSHPFRGVAHTIQDTVKPNSVFSWPFKLSFVHSKENKKIYGDYWPDLKRRIDDFTGKFKKGESIMFFYANYDNPVSADDMKYLLLGCSVIDEIDMPGHFPFTKMELKKMGKGEPGSRMKNFPTMNWAIQFTHQHDKSLMLPYHEYVKHVEEFPEEYEKLNDIRVVIEEPSLIRSFKYVTMDIDDDKCLYLLYKIKKSIFKIREHNRQVIEHNLDEEERRINALIKMVWDRRGIYPSLDKVIGHFLQKDCTELSDAIKVLLNKEYDLIDCFKNIFKDEVPAELEKFEDDLDDLMETPQFKRNFKAYLKLSLFNLTEFQINRIVKEYHDSIIVGLEANPYLIYEYYKPKPPANELDTPDLIEEQIDVYKIDVGMMPDSSFLKRHRKIQNIRESAPERIRSLMIEYLWSLEDSGHTYDNLRNILKSIKEYPLIYHMESAIDENGILDIEDEYRSHFKERLHIETVEHEKYIYLKELYRAERIINDKIAQLINRTLHVEDEPDYHVHIQASIDILKAKIIYFDDAQFKDERKKLYQNIFSKSLFLLTGKPGSGKTFETSHVIKHLKFLNQGMIILAPTGKAALRISENIKANTGIDQKAQTIDRFIYENGFWWAYEDWDCLHDLPEREKLTVTNLIIDESSMIDIQKLYILFSIIKFTDDYPKRIIFVGDENQLPPIGFGKPFHDIINHVVSNDSLFHKHYIHLATNCRQENDINIIKLAEAFSDKNRYYEEPLNLLYQKGKVSDGLEIYYWKTKEDLLKNIQDRVSVLLDYELKAKGIKADNDIKRFNLFHGLYENGHVNRKDGDFRNNLNLEAMQILSPYRPGFYGVVNLNRMVQEKFKDSKYKDHSDKYFNHSDKIIRITNYYSGYGRDKKMVLSNGSIGVMTVHKGGWEKKYFFKDTERILAKIDDEDQFDLAYAITIHKSQGSDFSNVFLIIPNKLNLLNKELIYTALTRSKQRLFLYIYDDPENLLVRSKGISALLVRQSSIFEQPEDKQLRYYPRKGEKPVKSKAEYIIHNALQRSGLKFKYEEELRLKNLSFPIHPDFVIKLEDGTKIYWEHLGMLDTRKYFNDWMRRKSDYETHGLFDLVVTSDDMNGIEDKIIDKLIDDIRNKRLKETPESKFSKHHYQLYL